MIQNVLCIEVPRADRFMCVCVLPFHVKKVYQLNAAMCVFEAIVKKTSFQCERVLESV